MSNSPRERSEVRAALSPGKKVEVREDGRIVRYRIAEGDGLVLTIDRVTTREGTSIRIVHAVGFEFRPDTPLGTDVDLRAWTVVGYCRFGAHKMQFDSGEFEGHACMSPRGAQTEVRVDATFSSPRIDLLLLRRHIVRLELSVSSPWSALLPG